MDELRLSTERRPASRLGPEESRLDREALRRLIQVGRSLVSELDPEEVLGRVLDAARDLTGARYAALGVLDEERQGLERFVTSGLDRAAHRAIGDLPRGRGVLGVLIRDPRPLRLADVGTHPESYGFPAGHPPMSSFLGVPIVIRGEAWGNLYLTEKPGGEFDEADEEAIVVLAGWAATAIENARLYRGERARRAELERAVRSLETTTAIARAVGAETDIGRVLELIVKRGRALVEARSMIIALVADDELVVRAGAGQFESEILGFRFPVEGSVAGRVLRAGASERLTDMTSDVLFYLAQHIRASTGLFVPLTFRSRSLGVLAAFDRIAEDAEFHSEHERLMEAFAASAATAVATAQNVAAQSLQRSIEASERERARWARELHDETLQDLGGLRLAISAARRADDVEIVRSALAEALDQIDAGIAGLRHLITELRPASLDELGVQAAIEALVERTVAMSGLELTLEFDVGRDRPTADRLPMAVEVALYRLVQEALTNIVKHAEATTVSVRIAEAGDSIDVAIADDGRGFDTNVDAAGFGLIGMRERVALLDGTLAVESGSGGGTTVRARIPAGRGS